MNNKNDDDFLKMFFSNENEKQEYNFKIDIKKNEKTDIDELRKGYYHEYHKEEVAINNEQIHFDIYKKAVDEYKELEKNNDSSEYALLLYKWVDYVDYLIGK